MRGRERDGSESALARELGVWPQETLRSRTDGELLAALRRGERYATHEFIARFHPMLMREGRRYDLSHEERVYWAAAVLHDLAVNFRKRTPALRGSLGAYVTRSFRNALLKDLEELGHERLAHEGGRAKLDTSERWTVGTLCSEASLRAAAGPSWEPWPVSAGVERLATMLEEGLSDEELLLLGWIANRQRIRDIARLLGEKRETLTVRVWRLRHQLKELARTHIAAFDPEERSDLRRFFRETTFLVAEALRTTEPPARKPHARPPDDGRDAHG